jgi:Flp pilus assembly protein TadG
MMRNPLSLMRQLASTFLRGEGGSVVAEGVIVLPLFLWSYIALFVYWDSFRSMNTVQKAAYTISDMISREQKGIKSKYITGMNDLMEYLIDDDQDAKLRVSSVTWSDTNSRFELHWSYSPHGAMTPLTTASLQDLDSAIPTMSGGDFVLLVEVEVPYSPRFDIGMDDKVFHQFIVTRPRFLPCLPLNNISCPVS